MAIPHLDFFAMYWVVGISMAVGLMISYMVRDITFFSPHTDNERIIQAAARFHEWGGWPSGMHQFSSGKAHMKELAVLLLAVVQRLVNDLKSDYSLVFMCILSNVVSGILIYIIAVHYWGVKVGLLIFTLFMTSFWPQMINLWGGVVAVAQLCFLFSVYFLQAAHMTNGLGVFFWYFASGIAIGAMLFSSASSRKYLPLSIAAYLWSIKETATIQNIFKNEFFSSPSGGCAVLLAVSVAFLVVAIWSKFSSKSFLKIVYAFIKIQSTEKNNTRIAHFSFWLSLAGGLYLLINLMISVSASYWVTQLSVVAGVVSIAVFLTYPNVLRNLYNYYAYAQYGKPSWRNRFHMYKDFFAAMGKPIKDDMRGGGLAWLVRYFLTVAPFLVVLSVFSFALLCQGFFQGQLSLGTVLVITIIAVSPIAVGEITKGTQLGRSYYPGLLGILFFIGQSFYLSEKFLPSREIFGWFVVLMTLANIVWNAWVFFSDVLPARMAPSYLMRMLRKHKIKKFYTYNSPYNDSLVKCFPASFQQECNINYCRSIKDIEEGYVVIPGTNPKSLQMSDYPQGKDKEFNEDLDLNRMMKSREIIRLAVASFKTFGTSRMWVHEAEVTTYRDLILREITSEDRWRGHAWLLKI